jgi:hypothetical protein
MHAVPDIDIVAERMQARYEELAKQVPGKIRPARKRTRKAAAKATPKARAKPKARTKAKARASPR